MDLPEANILTFNPSQMWVVRTHTIQLTPFSQKLVQIIFKNSGLASQNTEYLPFRGVNSLIFFTLILRNRKVAPWDNVLKLKQVVHIFTTVF